MNTQVTEKSGENSNFSARRKTHNETSDSAAGAVNQIRGVANQEQSKQYNATQKSPNLNNAVHFGGRAGGAKHLSSKSPDKTNRGLGMIQSKGLITSEGITNNHRSKASITNFASSLREDELMISSS